MEQPEIAVGILAGGKSSRMGQNKALLTWNNQTFIEIIKEELSSFSKVFISAAQRGTYEDLGCQMVYDQHTDIGPIEGIYQILKASDQPYVFICAADMPFLKKELVTYMSEFISSDYDCYCLMDEEHIHPLCAIYATSLVPVIEKLIASGQYKLMHLLQACRTKYIKLELSCFDQKVVKNINTKQEYRALSLPIVFCVSAVKNSGKTGLIEKLINEFIHDSYRVGVIKHDGHDYEMDHKGTDTDRFRQAKAAYTAIFSDTQFSINGTVKKDITQMIAYLEKEQQVDVIIIEGMKAASYPKIEVVRKERSTEPVCDPHTLICLATDIQTFSNTPYPVYDLNDSKRIYECVKAYFHLFE